MDIWGWPANTWVTWGGGILVVVDLAFRVVAAAVVSNNRRPSSAVAWLLAIFFIPFLGLFAFLLIGSPKLSRKRRRKQRRISEVIYERTSGDAADMPDDAPAWLAPVVRMNRTLGAMPMVDGTTARLETDYDASLAAMAAAVDDATDYVHAEFYILSSDETTDGFFTALERATARGVTVRVLFDHLASLRIPGYRATCRRLTAAGVQWHPMLSVNPFKKELLRPDLRNHRKLLVIDGDTGFIGSQNLIDRRYGKRANREKGREWVDIMARVTGRVVLELDAVFRTDWYSETDELLDEATVTGTPEPETPQPAPQRHAPPAPHEVSDAAAPEPPAARDIHAQVVPSGPGFDSENNLALFNALIYAATHRVAMVSPYFIPDESLMMAITTAAHRGLHVELFASEKSDQFLVHHAQRSYYQTLLEAGVDIWLYPQPYVLHAKTLTIDDHTSVIGSSNMDIRSFQLNLECSVMLEGATMATQLRAYEDSLRDASRRLDLREWKRRPYREQIVDGICRLTSALM